MYHFAVIALLGLATLKLVDLLGEFVPALSKYTTFLRLAIGVVAAVAIDYSVFDGFGIDVRERAYGVWATGITIGSMATAWHAAFSWLGETEDGTTEHKEHGRPRMAA